MQKKKTKMISIFFLIFNMCFNTAIVLLMLKIVTALAFKFNLVIVTKRKFTS